MREGLFEGVVARWLRGRWLLRGHCGAGQLPSVPGRISGEDDPTGSAVRRLPFEAGAAQPLLGGGKVIAEPHSHVGTSGRTALGGDAEMDLPSVVSLEPQGVEAGLDLGGSIHGAEPQDIDQEPRLGLGPLNWNTEIDMFERRHGSTVRHRASLRPFRPCERTEGRPTGPRPRGYGPAHSGRPRWAPGRTHRNRPPGRYRWPGGAPRACAPGPSQRWPAHSRGRRSSGSRRYSRPAAAWRRDRGRTRGW